MAEKISQPPEAPDPHYQRYSQQPFPPYRFIPGINPHPQRDPQGHSYGKESEDIEYISPNEWRANQNYLYGVDLYNYAYWWEAHEAWEEVWHTTKKDVEEGQFLQGLIQISAAFIKWHLHQEDGMVRLYEIGINRLESVEHKHPKYMGLDLTGHLKKLKKHFELVISESEQWPNPIRNYPFLVLNK